MTWFPFIFLGFGALIGIGRWGKHIVKLADTLVNFGLVILMLTLGIRIGSSSSLINSLLLFGFRCLVTSLSAIIFSVIFTLALEKTVIPLEEIKRKLHCQNIGIEQVNGDGNLTSPLVWIMPLSIILGILAGFLIFPPQWSFVLNYTLTGSLVILYTSVGIGFATNKAVLTYLRILNWRVGLISIAVILGSLFGGYISGIILSVPSYIAVTSAAGMSYYSITGAYLTQMFGIEAGAYGFLVNVMREFVTVLCLPFLIKISQGSAIASGAAGNMDTMLAPITKYTGAELGIVTLITGTILTFLVPLILPALVNLIFI